MNDFRGQFSFATFSYRLYIEGTEVPIKNFTLTYKENEPTRLLFVLSTSINSKNFLSNVLNNKPTVVLAIKGIGEHYNEDWHIGFIGYVIDYGITITQKSVDIHVEAIDFLNLLKETKMYVLNPAMHWVDLPMLYAGMYKGGGVLWSADRLNKLLGDYLTGNFIDAFDRIMNYTGLYTTINVVEYKRLVRKYGSGATEIPEPEIIQTEVHSKWFWCCSMDKNAYATDDQYYSPKFFIYPRKSKESNTPPDDFSMIQYTPSPEVKLTVAQYFAGYEADNFFDSTCQNIATWQTLCFHLNRLAWLINEFLKWATKTPSGTEDYDGYNNSNWDYRLALGFSNAKDNNGIFIEEFAYATVDLSLNKNAGWRGPGYSGRGAKNSMHKCAGAADIRVHIYKRNKNDGAIYGPRTMHIYELVNFALLPETFGLGGCGLYVGSLDSHYMHVDIGPHRSWGSMPNATTRTSFSSLKQAADYRHKTEYKNDGHSAFNSLFTAFMRLKKDSIVRQADIALYNARSLYSNKKTEKNKAPIKKWQNIINDNKFIEPSGGPISENPSDHSLINLDYGLSVVRVRQECKDYIEDNSYAVLNPLNFPQDEYAPLPWSGIHRYFLLDHIISPMRAERWSVTRRVIKGLIAGQANTLSNIEYSLWDIVQLFLNSTMYQFVPIPFGGIFSDDTNPKLWAIIPKIETVDIDSTCVPIPEVNKFYATGAWSDIEYSINISRNPTVIAGLIDVGDANVLGDETSPISRVATLFPLELAMRVEGDDRDMKLRTEFTMEENWRGPNRLYKNYDLFRLGLLSAELAKSSKAQQYIELYRDTLEEEQLNLLLHDMALRDYYVSVLGQNNLSFSVGYWPYVLVGYPAQFVTERFNIYGIVHQVSISGSGNHLQTTIYLRNAFNDWDKPYRLLKNNLGSTTEQSIYDPWLMNVDLANIKSLLVGIGAASYDSKNGLTYLRTRPLFYINKLQGLKIRKQMKDLVDIYSSFLRGIAMANAWDLFADKLYDLYSEKPVWYKVLDLLNNEITKVEDTHE